MKRLLLYLHFILMCCAPTSGQFITSESAQSNSYSSVTFYITGSSSETVPGRYAESDRDTAGTQAPMAALFKSMLVPGWGQLGNRKYVKAGLIIGLESVLIGAVVHWNDKTSKARKLFDNEEDSAKILSRFQTYDDARDRKNFYSWLLATTIFLSIFDAYVDAHLAKFPKPNKKISIEVMPPDKNLPGTYVSYNF